MRPLRELGVHDRFTRRSDGDRFRQVGLAALRHPGDFRREALDVVLLGLERALRDEERKVAVLHFQRFFFNPAIESLLDLLPDPKGPGPQDVASGNFPVPVWKSTRESRDSDTISERYPRPY